MTGLDAKFLYSETPTAHMHTVKVAVSDVSVLEGGFSYDVLIEVLEQQLVRLPPFRRRAVPVPLGLGHPVWVEDPEFDLRRHVSRRMADAPGGARELAAVVAEFSGTALARDRSAVVVKLHHAVADGSAAVALLQKVVRGATGDPTEEPVADRWHPEPIPTRRRLLSIAARGHVTRWKGLSPVSYTHLRAARASEARRRSFAERPPLPLHRIPKTSFNVSLTPDRTFAMTNLPLADLKAIRRAAGTTLNDVHLAVCAGALRRYLADRDELP